MRKDHLTQGHLTRTFPVPEKAGRHHFVFLLLLVFLCNTPSIQAQCPTNLGFESGTFDGWVCSAGSIDSLGVIQVFETPPIYNRHTMYTNTYPQALDIYGKFPVNCPNGSNYSIRLGNEQTGKGADRISYTLTVPPGQDTYSILYNYAVVFQNPNHADFEQPRFTAKVFDVSANDYISCSSFDFAASSNLPGFKLSDAGGSTSIYYKPWSPVTITLVGYGGKSLVLEFTVNDCTKGGHFGYAYLDVNEECSNLIGGNVICAGMNATTLIAPFGFESYTWYSNNFANKLGDTNPLQLDPAPPLNTDIAVELHPYPGSGCVDTLYTTMAYSAVPLKLDVVDSVSTCAPKTIDITAANITAGSSSGLKLSYYLDKSFINYVPTPKTVDGTGTFYIKASNPEGCIDLKSLKVAIQPPPAVTIASPAPVYYPDKVDLTNTSLITGNTSGISFSYWKDAATTIDVPNPKAVDVTGTFYIEAKTTAGCTSLQSVKTSIMIPQPPNAFSPNGDGINDYWQMPALNTYPDCRVDIYDRYGRLLFHSIGYSKPWDGTYNNKPVPVGTYYYIVKVDETRDLMSGSVTVLR